LAGPRVERPILRTGVFELFEKLTVLKGNEFTHAETPQIERGL
jgi:hypothetical protein